MSKLRGKPYDDPEKSKYNGNIKKKLGVSRHISSMPADSVIVQVAKKRVDFVNL